MKHLLPILIFLAGLVSSQGATINAASASQAAVNTAITSAVSGDTVLLPAGQSATWTSGISFTKGITLDFNGCHITRNFTGTGALISASGAAGGTLTIKNGTFSGGGTSSGFENKYILFNSNSGPVRITGCTFNVSGGAAQITCDSTTGQSLIDSCTFYASATNAELIHHRAYGANNQAGWLVDVVPGSFDALYIQNNTFNKAMSGVSGAYHVVATFNGARTVFRNNIINGGGDFDVHGTCGNVGGRWFECYDNTWNADSQMDCTFQLRAGSGVVTGNTLNNLPLASGSPNAGTRQIKLWEEDSGNDPYPALFQIGQGKQPSTGQTGVTDPLYIWGQTINNQGGGTVGFGVTTQYGDNNASTPCPPDPVGGTIVLNRDYVLGPKPGWTRAGVHPLIGGVSTVPTLSAISPTARIAGTGGFTLTATGTLFVNGAVVKWNGGNRTTSFVSATSLTATINAADVANAGSASVTVQNPNGETSGAQTFTITPVVTTGTLYVSKDTGVDSASQPGTLAQPFASLHYAIGRMVAGDEIIVRGSATPYDLGGGEYITGPNGTSGNPCAIRAYQGETPRFIGGGVNFQTAIGFTGVSWWEIEGLDISNADFIILVRGSSSNLRFINNNLHDSGNQIVAVRENASFLTFENNILDDGGSIKANENGEAFYIGTHQTTTDFTNNVVIKNNTITDTEHEAIEFKHNTYSCTADGNIISNVIGLASVVGDFGLNAITAFPTTVAGRPNPNHVIKNNIISGVGDAGYATPGAAIGVQTGAQVYNNVIYNSDPDSDGVHTAGVQIDSGDAFMRYYWNNTYSGPTAKAILNNGGTSSTGNNIGPVASTSNLPYSAAYFVSPGTGNFHLVTGSAPTTGGSAPPFAILQDRDGVTRGSPPDIGAYEATSQPEVVETPIISPASGPYYSAQSVTIAPITGATIRYTLDDTDPTSSTGTLYSGPVTISATDSIRARAFKSGATDSAVATASYEIGTWTNTQGGAWKNLIVPTQTGEFTWTFRATVSSLNADAIIGLSPVVSTAVTDLEPIFWFASGVTGSVIQARNDAVYAATTSFPYLAGSSNVYEFVATINVATNTYSATVAKVGETPVTIASNYLFRGGNGTATELDNVGIKGPTTGTVTVSQMSFGAVTPPVFPTLTNATVGPTGSTLTLTFSEATRYGTGGNGGWTISASGGAATLTPTANPTMFTISRTIAAGESGTISYVQPGNGVEANATGNADLATVTGFAFVNQSASDLTAPTPDPMTFSSNPSAISSFSISMTASEATDAASVEYYFDELSGNPGGQDSNWQSSQTYTDVGLSPGIQYTYRVYARDTSPAQNVTAPSASVDAATPILSGGKLITPTKQVGAGYFNP